MNLFKKMHREKRIFLDYASTTPVLQEVKEEMEKYLSDDFYNPASIYKEGVEVNKQLLNFRKKVAEILHVSSKDIIFTSGGTESNNLALLGVYEAFRMELSKPHFIISSVEHSSVLETAKEIERRGGELSVLGVNEAGIISIDELKKTLKPNTVLISVILGNNEIGTIEPISKISRIIKEYRKNFGNKYPYIHIDASQAANYLSVDVSALGVDLMTLDGSKIYGPKSSGVLVVRPGIKILPIMFGGGQEKGLRSGTENLFLISGFSEALRCAVRDRDTESKRLGKLRDYFIFNLEKDLPSVIINTPKENSLPNIISISVPGNLGEMLAIKLDQKGILVSTGSSCGIYSDIGGSTTIKAIGKEDLSESTLRFSMGRFTTEKDIDFVILSLKEILFS